MLFAEEFAGTQALETFDRKGVYPYCWIKRASRVLEPHTI